MRTIVYRTEDRFLPACDLSDNSLYFAPFHVEVTQDGLGYVVDSVKEGKKRVTREPVGFRLFRSNAIKLADRELETRLAYAYN